MTQLFPGYRYGPKGECKLFEREEDVPKGWLRNTPEGLAKLPKPKAASKSRAKPKAKTDD